jgi:serine protease AprX
MPVQASMKTASDWFGVTKARTDFGLTGNKDGSLTSYSKTDVVIAVIDTGIDAAHKDLDGGKVIGWKDFINGRTSAYDDNGHGTHVAGITAGSGDANSNFRGVAYGAALVGIKVLDGNGSGSMSTVTAGVDWAIQNKSTYNIKVINLSLGTSGSSDGTDSTSTAVNNAAANGIVPLVAAGNAGPARFTIGSPGAADKAITVGAMADVGELGFNITGFSSRGPTKDGRIKPDVAAPGFKIMAADANTSTGYVALNGTSMATPFAAGVAALMLQANGSLSPANIKSKMMSTAQDWGPTGKDIDYGSGRLQAYEAIKSAGGFSGTGPTVPHHGSASASLSGTGDVDNYSLNVGSTAYPIAITMVMTNWSSGSPDFDLYIYNPSGSLVGKSEGTSRQELVTFNPSVTGTYKITVKSFSGSGSYFVDASYR